MSNDYDTDPGNWQDYVNPASGVPRIGISPQGNNGVSQLVNPAPAPAEPQPRGVIDKLLGLTGERYQLWPERMARSGFTLPGDVASGKTATTDPATGEISDELLARVQDLAGLVGSGSLPAAAMSHDIGTLGMAGGKMVQPGAGEAPTFFSAMENAVRNAPQDKMSAQQWQGWLKNQPGVKQEELDWVGLPRSGGPVTKQELLDHVQGHGAQIKEVEKRGPSLDEDAIGERTHEILAERGIDESHPDFDEEFDNATTQADDELRGGVEGGGTHTKFSDYQLPGGKSYRELLLTMPGKITSDAEALPIAKALASNTRSFKDTSWDDLPLGVKATFMHDAKLKSGTSNFSSQHWDEPNVLAHLRMNDRAIPDGPEGDLMSLHLEEIQSDWHQQGRKQGYQSDFDASLQRVIDAEKRMNVADQLNKPMEEKQAAVENYHTESERHAKDFSNSVVPDAPFKTTWADLALKRAITKAAREGYDSISWTPGEQQAARYDLSKHVKDLQVQRDDRPGATEGHFTVNAIGHDGNHPIFNRKVPKEQLPDVIGKEMADRVLRDSDNAKEPNSFGKEYTGVDLKVGGEGMKKFYDKMLVDKANAIAKKFGGKVEYKELPQTHDASNNTPFDSRDRALQVVNHGGEIYAFGPKSGGEHRITSQEALEQFENDFTGPYQYVLGDKQPPLRVPVLRLTPKMKDAATGKGMPLFSAGLPFSFTPVDHDPFKDEKK